MANEIKQVSDIVTGFRNVIQDLLVPELKAIKKQLESHEHEFTRLWEEIRALRNEMKELRQEMNVRFEAIHEEMKDLRQEMNTRFEAVQKDIHELKSGQKEILLKLDIEKRVNKLEVLFQILRGGSEVVAATG
ncbi:MAG: hypothetical protein AB1567_11075 [bacterium]